MGGWDLGRGEEIARLSKEGARLSKEGAHLSGVILHLFIVSRFARRGTYALTLDSLPK